MHKIYLDLSDALEYIKESFEDAVIKGQDIKNARYHHNSVYQNAPSIVKYGLLSLNGIYRKGIKDFSKEILALSDDISSHVNGNDGISLSVVGLTDLYKDEDEYDPFIPIYVDFIISSDVVAYRNTTNYGNEFVSMSHISNRFIRAVDFRLLTLINELLDSKLEGNTEKVNMILTKFNALTKVCENMKKANLDAYVRELSLKESFLDYEKLAKNPYLKLKR